jgi:hypothetical protein
MTSPSLSDVIPLRTTTPTLEYATVREVNVDALLEEFHAAVASENIDTVAPVVNFERRIGRAPEAGSPPNLGV